MFQSMSFLCFLLHNRQAFSLIADKSGIEIKPSTYSNGEESAP